jgi:hypothetical protein
MPLEFCTAKAFRAVRGVGGKAVQVAEFSVTSVTLPPFLSPAGEALTVPEMDDDGYLI